MINKRIKELAEQAFQPINDMASEGIADRHTFEQAWFQEYNNKFAHLLLEDVMQTLFITGHESAVDALDKHFGFEQ